MADVGKLCITRRVGESFKIGDNIDICITNIRGNQVAVLITAPKSTLILRNELIGKEHNVKNLEEV